MIPRPFRVVVRQGGDPRHATLELDPEDGPAIEFEPGQYTMLYVFGVGEVPISISGDPGRPETLVHTIRAVGAVTGPWWVWNPGDVVGVRGPFGSGWPVAEAGTGICSWWRGDRSGTAAAGVVRGHDPALRDRTGLPGLRARSPSDLLYRDELEDWEQSSDLDVEVTVDVSDRDWRGDVGMVTGVLPECGSSRGARAMLCGPEVMMKVVARELLAAGSPTRGHPRQHRAEHEVRHRAVRALPVRFRFRLLGRPGLSYADVGDRWQVAEI
jgi:NAD(P)H-flavin reductase